MKEIKMIITSFQNCENWNRRKKGALKFSSVFLQVDRMQWLNYSKKINLDIKVIFCALV